MIAAVFLLSKLDIKESIASYDPQRLMRQFGFDQGSVWISGGGMFLSIKDSESWFITTIKSFLIVVRPFGLIEPDKG